MAPEMSESAPTELLPFKTPLFAKLRARTMIGGSRTHSASVAPMDVPVGKKRPLPAASYDHDDDDDTEDHFFSLAKRQQHQSERKPQLLPAHEVRFLRDETQRLQRELQQLCGKWYAALPDPHARLAACEAAKQKTLTAHVEQVNAQLKAQLQQQQLSYALLQRTLSTAPLWQMGRACDDMMERLHCFLHLDTRLNDRVDQLTSRFDLAIRTAASVTDALTKNIALDHASPQLVPFSRTSARGLERHTLISNVFICRIPIYASGSDGLKRVYDAAVATHKVMQHEMSKRLGILMDTERVHELGDHRSYTKVTRRDSDFSGSSSNVAFAAELVNDDLAVITTDFTDEDELLDNQNSKSKDESELTIDACSTYVRLYWQDTYIFHS